jgi:hypothetical protein
MLPRLRNPGPWSFAIFACASLLVGFLFWRGAPDAAKLAGSLVAVVVATFGARSAVERRPSRDSSPPSPVRQVLESFPDLDVDESADTVEVPVPSTKRDGGGR